tara:strand:- start:1582 stop:2493 length:912 start_codon:yes stop_codon:yes gene_type:complete
MKILLFILLPIILLVTIISEFYLRNLGLGDPIRYDSNILYGYSPKINQKKNRFKNSTVTINDFGLRSIYNWKNNKEKKIVFLGDSVTYGGSYIDDKDLFSHIVCKKLDQFTCGNAGVNSYGVHNTIMRSKYDERIQTADIFVFLFPPDDFLRDYRNSKTAHFYLNNKKFLLPSITEAISFISTKYDLNNYISKLNDTKTKEDHDLKFIDYSIKLLKEEVENKKHKNKIVLVLLSNRKDDKFLENKLNKYIKTKLQEKIDIHLLENYLTDDFFFYDNSVHLSEKGHEVVAERISSILQKIIQSK